MESDKNKDLDTRPDNEEKLEDLSQSGKSQLAQDLEIVRRAAKDRELGIGDTFSGSDGGSAGDGGGA